MNAARILFEAARAACLAGVAEPPLRRVVFAVCIYDKARALPVLRITNAKLVVRTVRESGFFLDTPWRAELARIDELVARDSVWLDVAIDASYVHAAERMHVVLMGPMSGE